MIEVSDVAQLLFYSISVLAIIVTLTVWIGRRLLALTELLDSQMRTDSGNSLLDKIDKLEENHKEAEKHWKSLEISQSELGRKMLVIEYKIDGIVNKDA